jgi:hypothetical protein
MTGQWTGISPFLEKMIVEIDSFFKLDQINPSPHLTEKLSLIEFE